MTQQPTASTDRSDEKGDRIAKLLARAGLASRREVERMIADGRVALDGVVLETPATILRSLRGVTVDGRPVAPPRAAQLFLFHKPAGLIVTERDPAGRPTIYDRLPADLPRVMPVGRLDLATEGLLLLTTDGGLKRRLELPATGVERTYRARAYGDVTQAMLEDLIEGVEIDGVRYGSIDANLERRTGANVWIELTLTEGKNREVRRVLEHLGLQVGRLIRTRYGPFVLGDLAPGELGEVKQHDLVAFAKTLEGGRRAKGADLDTLVAVSPRAGPSATQAAPSPPPPSDAPSARAAPPPARPKRGGWGSKARPSRPAPSGRDEERPRRGGPPRQDSAERAGPGRRPPAGQARDRKAEKPEHDRAERPRGTLSPQAGSRGRGRPSSPNGKPDGRPPARGGGPRRPGPPKGAR